MPRRASVWLLAVRRVSLYPSQDDPYETGLLPGRTTEHLRWFACLEGFSMSGNQPARYVSIAAAAEARGVSSRTIRRYIAAGLLPAVRFGPRLVRIDPADLDLHGRMVPSAADIA